MKKYGFGVDVGGTTVKMGFFETSGELLDKWEIKTDTSDNGKAVLPDIAQAIDNKLAQEGISKSDVEFRVLCGVMALLTGVSISAGE